MYDGVLLKQARLFLRHWTAQLGYYTCTLALIFFLHGGIDFHTVLFATRYFVSCKKQEVKLLQILPEYVPNLLDILSPW